VFKPALRCPFKVLRECKQASGELRQRKRPVLAEFGYQFDLYWRVERQHRNADGGTGVLACVTEDPAQQFRGAVDHAGLSREGRVR
jgi:hypothetical protein